MRVLAAFAVAVLASGCAALFNNKQTNVQMNSNPVGAEVLVNGNRVGTTPMSVQLSNKDNHTVTFRMAGRNDVSCILNRKVEAGWIILDVLSGLIPIVIDAATGSWYGLDDACNATLPTTFADYAGIR